MTGLNGAGISLRANFSQSRFLKNGCLFNSTASSSPPPNRFRGSLIRSLLMKSATSLPSAERKCNFRITDKVTGQDKFLILLFQILGSF